MATSCPYCGAVWGCNCLEFRLASQRAIEAMGSVAKTPRVLIAPGDVASIATDYSQAVDMADKLVKAQEATAAAEAKAQIEFELRMAAERDRAVTVADNKRLYALYEALQTEHTKVKELIMELNKNSMKE